MEGSWPNLLTTQDSEENHQAKLLCKIEHAHRGPLGCMGLGCMVEKLEASPFLVSVLVFDKLCLETDGTGCVLGLDFDELNRFNFSVKLVQVDFLKALLQVLWQVSMHVSRFNWHIQVVWARHQIWHTLNIL